MSAARSHWCRTRFCGKLRLLKKGRQLDTSLSLSRRERENNAEISLQAVPFISFPIHLFVGRRRQRKWTCMGGDWLNVSPTAMCWARVRGKKAEAEGVVTTPCASTWLATCAHVTELWLARELTRHMHVTRGYGDRRSFDEFSSHVRQLLTESCTRFLYTKSCFSLPDHVIQQSTEVSLSITGRRTEDCSLAETWSSTTLFS